MDSKGIERTPQRCPSEGQRPYQGQNQWRASGSQSNHLAPKRFKGHLYILWTAPAAILLLHNLCMLNALMRPQGMNGTLLKPLDDGVAPVVWKIGGEGEVTWQLENNHGGTRV